MPNLEHQAYDYILVGGGLQNGLVALAILHRQPWATVLLLEKAELIGGNHTWCFHLSDVPESAHAWFKPLMAHEWAAYDVYYPDFHRCVELPYGCTPSSHFRRVLTDRFSASDRCHILYDSMATTIEANRVQLADGRSFKGHCVIDARGQIGARGDSEGYQKFVGLEVELSRPHGLSAPILMDGRVPQTDGLRFVYVLPFGPRHLLVEDTYFSDHAHLDRPNVADAVRAYIESRNWTVAHEIRQESGILPLPWNQPPLHGASGVLKGGYGAGYFHPVTGYSLPLAVKFADAVSYPEPEDARHDRLNALNALVIAQRRNLHRLNRVLFEYYAPEDRWHLMARFYRRPEATIRRFYSMELTPWDIARIIVGPIPKKMRWTARRKDREDSQ
ncbi:MAG: lycopene beta-cyclase CrtY [Myxococcota bacterium]|nr:lycopene beta-cyclase CrtY [Myxococcota bacterium]